MDKKEIIENALKAIRARNGSDEWGLEVNIIDLLTDLQHLAAQRNLNFKELLEKSISYFEIEQ